MLTRAQARFLAKVRKTETCWFWTARIDKDGYGRFRLDGDMRMAHRAGYLLFVGPIAEGLQVDHLCRVRECVNPAHMEAVSARVNTLRSQSIPAFNARKTHCVRGHSLSGDNIRLHEGSRQCKSCQRERSTARRTQVAS